MSRNAQRLVTAAFLLFLGLALAATLLREEETYSFFENRTLAPKPVYSAQADGDGSYFSGWERYLSDHAAGRKTLLRLKTRLDLALGRPVVNDVVVTEEALLPYLPERPVDRAAVSRQAGAMADRLAEIQAAVEGYGGYYCYVGVPCQYACREEDYPWYLNNRADLSAWSVQELSRAAAERGVNFLDMGPVFRAQPDPDRLTSAVDNHYSIQGAYLTYRTILERIHAQTELEVPVLGEEDVTISQVPNRYLGSRTRKLLAQEWREDALYRLDPAEAVPFTRYNYGKETYSSLYALPEHPWEDVTYNLYMGGDLAETLIDTGREELPSVLVYGDSFTNALECVMYLSFDKMYSLDLRHYKDMPLEDYIAGTRPQVVVCIRDYESLLDLEANGGG